MTLQDLMMLYGVTLGARYTKKQRYLFATQLKEFLTEQGWDFSVQIGPRGKTARGVENIVVGDISRAKTIFVAPYDTPAKAVGRFFYYPFEPERTLKEERRQSMLRTLLGVVVALLAVPCVSCVAGGGSRWFLLPTVIWLIWAYRLMKGSANKVNFNRASASIAVCVKLMEDLKPYRKQIAFVFCDRATTSYEGYKVLGNELPSNANVVVLDAIAKGDALVLAHAPLGSLRAKRLLEYLPQTQELAYSEEEAEKNLLSFFPGGSVLTSGRWENGSLLIEDSRSAQDHRLDLPRLEKITEALEQIVIAQ